MATNYQGPGDTLNWTNGTGSAVSSGDTVAVANLLGIAVVDIANGATGEVQVGGTATVVKVSTAVIAQGEMVMWDTSEGNFDDNAATPATGDITNAAIAMEAAGNGTTSVRVKLNVSPGTVA